MRATRIALMLFASVFLAQWQSGKSSVSSSNNSTTAAAPSLLDDEEEVDEALENMDFAEFKERYRRLIQYRTYYVASNYLNSQVLGAVNQQHPQQQHGVYDRETAQPTNPLIRKPQRLVPLGSRPIDPVSRRKPVGRPSNGAQHKQEGKFVPSVQYDPRDVGGDADYFTPLKHAAAKLNYDQADYGASLYDRVQQSRIYARPEVAISRPELQQQQQQQTNGYYKSRAPTRPAAATAAADNLHLRKYIPARGNAPPPPPRLATQHQDYLLDYGTRTGNNKAAPFRSSDYNYQAEDYEPVRVNIEPPPPRPVYAKPTRILAQSRPTSPFHLARNPAVNLHDIMKSLQLTNRLPEMLNQDNIDSSIRTLVEILSILNNAKQAEFPRAPPETIAAPPPQLLRNPAPIYGSHKPSYVRPKVVTETRFQATPSPPIVRDENRYETESYEEPSVNYIAANPPKQQNVEYYTPLVQDVDDERFRPTQQPVMIEGITEHRYEINEDLADDILEQERRPEPPGTTETPVSKFRLPDGASGSQLVPPTTLKYGATRGKPNVDYPAYAAIPETEFNCKEQRYKGFFGDPSTGCQVWHYCDLNGGKSSFLCPNGTIFSQVALTCDWWFNVHCESTTQLYVLNERLYKYILPIMPKFPEDFSGPEVDRYLELKFKEMEAKLKEKKLKKQQEKDKVKEKLQALETEE